MATSNWNKIGLLERKPTVGAIVASAAHFGLIGTSLNGDGGSLFQRMRNATARIVRADRAAVEVVFEANGRIVAIDGVGSVWFAIVGEIKESSPGSSYRLLRSTDSGDSWNDCGPIPADSVTSVLAVGEQQAWVLGANTLACTDDAGAKWRQLTVDGERNPVNEYLRRDGEGVALLAPDKLHTTRDNGTSWQLTPMASVRLRDLHDGVLLGVWSGLPGVGDRNATTPFARLGDDRSPLRLVASGNALRVLSRAQAAERGPEMTIHESDDRGLNWSNFRVSLTAKVDIAGPAFGLGVDVIGGVHVQTEG